MCAFVVISWEPPTTDDSLHYASYTYRGLNRTFCTGSTTSTAAALTANQGREMLRVKIFASTYIKTLRCNSNSIRGEDEDLCSDIYLCLENTLGS